MVLKKVSLCIAVSGSGKAGPTRCSNLAGPVLGGVVHRTFTWGVSGYQGRASPSRSGTVAHGPAASVPWCLRKLTM